MTLQKIPFYPVETSDKRRIAGLVLFVFILYAILISQFYRVQIIEGAKWVKYAQGQHNQTVIEPFRRGTFWSNTSIKRGHPEIPQAFAIDLPKFHLYIDPMAIPETRRSEIAQKLGDFLSFAPSDVNWILKELNLPYRSRKVAPWLSQETRDAIKEWWFPYARRHKIARNGLFFLNDYQRAYPFDKLLGQVLHTIQDTKEERTKQGIPTGGLEMYFNNYLKGKPGKRIIERSLRHSLGMGQIVTPPENGADIHLSINHYLQAIAEEELAKGVKKARAKGGWAVMMDPNTGEILVLAQYPFFSPSDYQYYFNHPDLISYTRVKAVMDSYEPGSTTKPLTLAVCLMANEELIKRGEPPLFSPQEKIATSKGNFPGRKKPIVDTHLHYYLNMDLALQKSSNIYMARMIDRVIQRLGDEWYRSVLHDCFGLGQKTGIELPAESAGMLPKPGKTYPNGLLEWSVPTPYSLAMGYNYQATSIQMLRAYAVLANGGKLVTPTLIRKIIKTDVEGKSQTILDNTTEEKLNGLPLVLPPQVTKEVLKSMKFVTKRGGGAVRADIHGYTEAGKTSTAHKAKQGAYTNTYFSTFMGIAPVSEPRFILLVAVDEPERFFIPGVGGNHFGGACAAPIFREIARRSLEYLGTTPDDPYGYPVGDPRHDSEKADWTQEIRQLEELYKSWNTTPK
ncbi:MAG: pbp2 [Chlamydiales bacterium]|jgi:cell division protein FtsI (penicillin-binding protein 3)|nr:pbp2 [Chlamydiales bacterium]